jgi:RNA polymerase sigma factor (sigma-70 family)
VDAVVDLDEAFRKYRPLVTARVKSKIGAGTPDWEDVVSKVFLSLVEFARSGKFRGDSEVGTLIYTITDRRIADYFRQMHLQGFDIRPEIAIYDTTLTDIEQRQFMSAIVSAMDRLTDRQRDVFSLCGLRGMTVPEAANQLDLSKGRTQAIYTRAREIITKAINEWQSVNVDPETLVGWVERLWLAYLRLGIRTRKLDSKNEQFGRRAKEEIVRRLMED